MQRNIQILFTLIFLNLSLLNFSFVFGQTVEYRSFLSTALGETKNVNVYLPPGYSTSPNTFYPVIYYYHGWSGDEGYISTIASVAEDMIPNEIDPCIIVCPSNNPNDYFDGTMYLNSPVWKDYEDYNTQDVIKTHRQATYNHNRESNP